MPYLVPFSILNAWLETYRTGDGEDIRLSYDDFLDIVKHLLNPVMVQEDWYMDRYPIVAKEIGGGQISSPTDHFIVRGYFRGYQPFAVDGDWTQHRASFGAISASLPIVPARGGFRIDTTRDALLGALNDLLMLVPVDEGWYRARYPDAAAAIDSGKYASAAAHFRLKGYAEARWPFEIIVDDEAYLRQYPDLRSVIEKGRLTSGVDHFQRHGYREGRRPGRIPRSDNPFYHPALQSKGHAA